MTPEKTMEILDGKTNRQPKKSGPVEDMRTAKEKIIQQPLYEVRIPKTPDNLFLKIFLCILAVAILLLAHCRDISESRNKAYLNGYIDGVDSMR